MARSRTACFGQISISKASGFCLGALALAGVALGCRGYQYGHLIKNDQPDMVGSHSAGSEVFNPLIDETVAKLLGTAEVASQHL